MLYRSSKFSHAYAMPSKHGAMEEDAKIDVLAKPQSFERHSYSC